MKWLKTILVLWAVNVTIGSFLPGPVKQTFGIKPHDQNFQGNSDLRHRAVHFLSFGFPGLLLGFISPKLSRRVLFCLAVISFGISIEFAQSVVFASNFEWWDVRDDLYGTIMFSVVGLLVRYRHTPVI
jgi:hypothetical protein